MQTLPEKKKKRWQWPFNLSNEITLKTKYKENTKKLQTNLNHEYRRTSPKVKAKLTQQWIKYIKYQFWIRFILRIKGWFLWVININ